MNLNDYFNRFLKLTKTILNEKDHQFITIASRQLQDDLAKEILTIKNNGNYRNDLSSFILNKNGDTNEQTK